jgi:HSP20 family protein
MITITFKPNPLRASQLRDKPETFFLNWNISSRPHLWRPPTDLIELEDRFVVRIEIAGMKEDDFAVTLDQNLLIVQGVRPDLSERRAYHQMEINFGEFLSTVEIPGGVEVESIAAEYKSGFLWITLPFRKPHHIQISE